MREAGFSITTPPFSSNMPARLPCRIPGQRFRNFRQALLDRLIGEPVNVVSVWITLKSGRRPLLTPALLAPRSFAGVYTASGAMVCVLTSVLP